MRHRGTMLVVNNLLRCRQVGALPLWELKFCGANRLLQQGAGTHTDRALWTLWMLIRVNQLDSTSQTFTTNVLVDLT